LALLVTDNFFSLYGLAQPKLGRLFLTDEYAVPAGAPVVILSEEIWRNRFGADPQIIGAVIKLNRQPFTVVGVIPARFSGRLRGPGIWIPYTMQPQFFGGQNFFQETGAQWLTVEARLRAGRARSAAQAELDVIARQLDQLQPSRQTTMTLTNGSLLEEPSLRTKLFWVPWLIMGALSLVLFITCLNVTLLLLSRAAARQREMAIRLALGAGRRRLLRMLLTESLILAVAAGAISAYLVYQAPGIFERKFAEAPNYPLRPDWLVFVYLAGVTLLAGCLAGLAPAVESLKVNLSAALNGNGSLFGGGNTKWKSRDLLVSAQVAMSVAILALAGIFLRAQYTMFTTGPGVETRQVLLAPLEAEPGRYTMDAAVSFNRTLEQRARALPGVQAVCYASAPPGGGFDAALEEFRLPGQTKEAGKPAGVNVVSADFFETFRIPIVAGRTFRENEATAKGIASVAVVSETFARRLWGDEDPLDKVIEDAGGEQWRVVGVARDAKSMFGGVEGPQFYRLFNPQYVGSSLMIRFVGDVRPLAEGVRSVVGDLDREMTVTPQTLRSLLDVQAARFWVIVRMILLLGVVAMLIAVIGIYGVAAFAINQRTKEIGIRMALGATKNDIMRWALRLGLKPILAGLAIGLALAVAGARVMEQALRQMPVGFETRDPLVYVTVTSLLSLVVAPAIFGPALRASQADPIRALRHD
jgi:predicted permease